MFEAKVYDGETNVVLQFEHSLLSLSKWEAKYKKPFLTTAQKTAPELFAYFEMMLLSPEHDLDVVLRMDPKQHEELTHYINDAQSATTMPAPTEKGKAGVVTSEVMYGWLVGLKIPFHPVETWHLNRMNMLVRVVQANNEPPKKISKTQALSDWAKMNAANRERYKSKG